jgi:hypothetical protein
MTRGAAVVVGGFLSVAPVLYGLGLGVAGGAYLRETGRAFAGEAEQFWLWVFLVLSLALAIPRATRRSSFLPIGAYVLALALGYWVGHAWGNVIGWHPD